MSVSWTITNPNGVGVSTLEVLRITDLRINFRTMAVSTARMNVPREIDSMEDWWAFDSLVTIYRDGLPYYTGRVQESSDIADGNSETRPLDLADAWLDLQEVIYREPWNTGAGMQLMPRCIVGRDASGQDITTGQQISEVIDYAITQGVALQKGTIAAGMLLWPSEVRNQSCESIIITNFDFIQIG